MIIEAVAQAAELKSRFTPMPTSLHLWFCLFATLVFLVIFLRRKTVSSIIWIMICDTTAILQFYSDSKTATAVGICEIVLFAILIWVSFGEWKERKRREAEEAALEAESEEAEDNLEDIEKLVRNEMSKLANDGDDIIKNAFEEN